VSARLCCGSLCCVACAVAAFAVVVCAALASAPVLPARRSELVGSRSPFPLSGALRRPRRAEQAARAALTAAASALLSGS
jgi:hypothetical protein